MARYSLLYLMTAAAAFSPSLVMAHQGHGEAFGFAAGFAHPVGGLDHILAMVMVGALAARLGGRALWLVPVSFVTVLSLGGALGHAGVVLPFVELGIALSVVVLGAFLALGLTASVAAAQGLVGFFAVFHGYAHGAEMPEMVGGLAYGAGFIAATSLLHAAGLMLGHAVRANRTMQVERQGGDASFTGLGVHKTAARSYSVLPARFRYDRLL